MCVVNELQSLQFSMSETLNFILMQGAVKNFAWNFSQELRFPVFQRLQQFLTKDATVILYFAMVRRCTFGLQSGRLQACFGFVKKSSNFGR